MGKFLKKRPSEGVRPSSLAKPAPGGLASTHPCLWEWMTLTVWEDGSSREPSSLTVFLDEGRLKACLSDKDAGMVAFTSGSSWEDLLASLETGLVEGSLDWRKKRDSWGKPPGKKA